MKENQFDEQFHRYDAELKAKAEATFWRIIGTLFKRRMFVLGMTAVAGVVAIVISLLLPTWYQSTTRLLAPESSATSPISAALMRSLPSAATAILGGGGEGDFERYISIMSSRSVAERVIERFDLVNVYQTEDALDPLQDAHLILLGNVEYTIDRDFGFLSVNVLDQDPQRSADIANFIVEELNRINMGLASQDASNFRRYVQHRYEETLGHLDSLKLAMQGFQERYGIYDIEAQSSAFLEQLATMRTEEIMFDIQYEALVGQYGPDNPQAQLARTSMLAAQRKREEAMAGQEDILPIPQSDVPDVLRQYFELEQEAYIQRSILEVVAPLYDQARFQEEREFASVQVVDSAVPPSRKAKPKRASIVIMTTVSVCILSILYVLASAWWHRVSPGLVARLRLAIQSEH